MYHSYLSPFQIVLRSASCWICVDKLCRYWLLNCLRLPAGLAARVKFAADPEELGDE